MKHLFDFFQQIFVFFFCFFQLVGVETIKMILNISVFLIRSKKIPYSTDEDLELFFAFMKTLIDIFLSILFKMKYKNDVSFNENAKTPKYYINVSQLSDQCFRGFFLSLLSKKSRDLQKFIL